MTWNELSVAAGAESLIRELGLDWLLVGDVLPGRRIGRWLGRC
jgi:hypothetical protein